MNLREMQARAEQLKKEIEEQRVKELKELQESIQKQVEGSPFSWDEVVKKPKVKRKPIQPKYRNPKNPNETWTGRGREPLWVKNFTQSGGTLSKIEIKHYDS